MRDRLPMIFSITALLVAVLAITPFGEAAYNAVLPRDSVGTLQLQRNAVKSSKIAPNAVQTAHVLNGSLLAEDFKAGQIPQGPKGDKGDKGNKGDTGQPGPSWGDVSGPTTSGGTYTPIAFSVTLPTNVGRRGDELKFLVFGRLNVELQCSSAGACGQSYILLVNDTPVPTSGSNFSGKASEKTNDQGSAFGVVTVRSLGVAGGTNAGVTRVRWGYITGNNVVQSSTAATVGAIRLGS